MQWKASVWGVLVVIAINSAHAEQQSPEPLLEQARTHIDAGERERALDLAERVLALGPDRVDILAGLGDLFVDAGDPETGADIWEGVVERVPDNARYWHQYGLAQVAVYSESSSFRQFFMVDDMIAAFERVVALDPCAIEARRILLYAYIREPARHGGSRAKAEEHAAALAEIDPVAGHVGWGTVYRYAGEPSKAAREYRKAVALAPEDDDLAFALGLRLQEAGDFQDAFGTFAALAKSQGTQALEAAYQVGRTAALSGRHLASGEKALLRYIEEGGTEDGPELPPAHWRLGLIYEHMGRRVDARAVYEQALYLDPDYENAAEAMEQLESAR